VHKLVADAQTGLSVDGQSIDGLCGSARATVSGRSVLATIMTEPESQIGALKHLSCLVVRSKQPLMNQQTTFMPKRHEIGTAKNFALRATK
jgi:hypothetical protein